MSVTTTEMGSIALRRGRRLPGLQRLRTVAGAWAFIVPAALVVFVLTIYPLGFAAVVSFFDYDVTRSIAYFVEWENYAELGAGPFVHSIAVTLQFALPAVCIEIVAGIGIAVLLQNRALRKLNPLIMGVILMPVLMAPVVSGATFKLLLNPIFGVLNRFLSWGPPSIDFLGNGPLALATLIAIDVWMWTPFVVLLVTAALLSVPEPLYEAAKIDGAGPVQRFRYITLPLIRPVLLVVILFRVMDIVKTADIPYAVTQGGPGSSTDFLSLLIYRTSFKTFNIGGGAAMSVVFVLLLMLPVLALYRLTRSKAPA